jgi:hypothetical protein
LNYNKVSGFRKMAQKLSNAELLSIWRDRSGADWDEYHEAVRLALLKRGVSDPSLDEAKSTVDSRFVGFAGLGCGAGGFVGYLIEGAPMGLTFWVVLTRGDSLGFMGDPAIKELAKQAFNFVLAGAVVGALGGLAVAALVSSGEARRRQ